MTQVAIATTALQDVRGLRRELLPWIAYHLHLGIAHFYVRSRAYPPTPLHQSMHAEPYQCVIYVEE